MDEFILYDDVQFTKNDWRNRNRIKTSQGLQWLTIPVGKSIHRKIRDVEVTALWRESHWKALVTNYRRANGFEEVAEWLQPLFFESRLTNLSQINREFIDVVSKKIGISTRITNSNDYELSGNRIERLQNLCLQANATHYVSGPAAQAYLDKESFSEKTLTLEWFKYPPQKPYPQLWGEFVANLSILDLLLNVGSEVAKQNFAKF